MVHKKVGPWLQVHSFCLTIITEREYYIGVEAKSNRKKP